MFNNIESTYYLRGVQYTVKPRFIVFVGGPEKKRWLRENDRCGAYIK
jgi:hypothetical protein